MAENRLLTEAEMHGITGDEPPLTDTDVRIAVGYALSGWYGDWLLAGGDSADYVRTSIGGGCAGWPTDYTSVSIGRSRRGLLIRVSDRPEGRECAGRRPAPAAVRAGRISWRTAEAVLRQLREPAEGTLFDLAEVSA